MNDYIKEIDELLKEYELTDIKDYIYKNLKKSIYFYFDIMSVD